MFVDLGHCLVGYVPGVWNGIFLDVHPFLEVGIWLGESFEADYRKSLPETNNSHLNC